MKCIQWKGTNMHSVHNLKVLRTCLARGNIFENIGFPKETR